MITISVCIIFVLNCFWNIAMLVALLDFLSHGKSIGVSDWITVILSLSLWFFTGVYLFGM